jgi:segregation and condensation protein A
VTAVDEVTAPVEDSSATTGFAVHLDNFEGPFDLLLQLISKHKLDITEVALSRVTDEFIAHIKALGSEWELEQTTQFLLVASTLLDLKIVRLLPTAELEDEEDLALLEARDLLFARLLQYRAFKQVAAVLERRLGEESRRVPRQVGLDARFAQVLPEVLISVTPEELAAIAARALAPRPEPVLSLAHLHAPQVSVKEQAATIVDRLRRLRTTTFRTLVADAPDMVTKVARFLALLELFREGAVGFEQVTPLGELTIRWTGADEGEIEVEDEYDDHAEPDDDTVLEDGDELTEHAGQPVAEGAVTPSGPNGVEDGEDIG